MKKQNRGEVEKVEEALVHYHRRPVEVRPGEFWAQRVMARLREEPAPEWGNGTRYGKIVWRFAFVASIAAVLLAAYAVSLDSQIGPELTAYALLDPAALDIVSSFDAL